ncbi:iron-sulfur cluster assembly scaffold protein [Collinsella tanakaei]|uniref:iron-sulfur cluster assembly scaffold protein n=1 Tax=Collinsella tanakaei TaxID=626935 RepID=UPI002F9442E9
MAKQRLTQDTPFLRTPDMYQIENDAPITEYADTTLDLIADAVNCGIPDGANAFCSVGKEKRGTVQMQLFARIDPDTETFEEVGFRSHGCLAAIGCAALLANKLPGKTFEQALAITKEELDEELGGLPKSRIYTLVFGIEAVRALIGDYCLRIKGYSLAQLTQEIPCDYMCVNCLLTENCSLRDERVDQEMRELGEIE